MRTRFATHLSLVLSLTLVSAALARSADTPASQRADATIGQAPIQAPGQVPGGFLAITASDVPYNFYFTRVAYSGWRNSWRTDYPWADRWIAGVLGRLTAIDVSPMENPVRLDDPDLRRFPFIYALEVGSMALTDQEVVALRGYLEAGGFLMIDDFWGSYQWMNWEREIRRVLPEFEIVDIPMDHPIFSTFYEIDEIVQVPAIGYQRRGTTHEQDGYVPRALGIFDDAGRLMVMINWNTDIGDAWEHAEDPGYPLEFSTYAYQIAANTIIYAMTR